MTSSQLFETLKTFSESKYYAQLLPDGLNVNLSDIFCKFIKDAARCNGYGSDIYYDMKIVDEAMKNYTGDKEFVPIWVGFRKLGVDSTDYVLHRIMSNKTVFSDLTSNYFALYSITLEHEEGCFYKLVLREYPV